MMIPEFCDLPIFAASLIIDFPNDNVPILVAENEWKFWGNQLIQEPSFSVNDAPRTDGFNEWKAWAQGLYYTMSNNN